MIKTSCQENPDLFFSENKEDITTAISICNGCSFKDKCLTQAEALNEVHGVWGGKDFNAKGYISVFKEKGLCQGGKHKIPAPGRCLECKAESQKRYNQKRSKNPPPSSVNRNKVYKRQQIGGVCGNNHLLDLTNVFIREQDGAVCCVTCKDNRKKPVIIPKEVYA